MDGDAGGLLAEAVRLDFDGRRVLAIDRLELAPGAKVAVTGPSGCGKTSLALALAGIQPVDAGRVRWGGTDLAALGEGRRDAWRRRHVGLVFQDFHLVPGLSVLKNVLAACYFDRWRPGPAERARALELLERCAVPADGRDVATLSRGEQQRVAIARALLFAPPILIADEPTASLDAASARAVTRLLLDEAERAGATFLAVSHDPALLTAIGTVARMEAGRLVG